MTPERITTTDGREQMRIVVGNLEITATKRAGAWEIEQRTPGPFASGLTEERAGELLAALAKLYAKFRRPGPAPRVECGACGRSVAVSAGLLSWHNARDPAPGRRSRPCRLAGERVPEVGL